MYNSELLRKLSDMKYIKYYAFRDRGAHAPYAPCMATPLILKILKTDAMFSLTKKSYLLNIIYNDCDLSVVLTNKCLRRFWDTVRA